MNREQKRAFIKEVQKKDIDKDTAKTYAEILGSGTEAISPRQDICEGESVKLNIKCIKARKNYERMTDKYKKFVDNNIETVFTAHVERPTLISFVEEPKWLFWSGDLIKIG